jgi:predicted Zn-dependent protease
MNSTPTLERADLPHAIWHRLEAVEGWLMLANPSEAKAELDQIPAEFGDDPNVLALQWRLAEATGQLHAAWQAAAKLCQLRPACAGVWICQANSLRGLRGVQAAADLLLTVADRFTEEPIVAYNLACYLAQLGNWQQSWNWLRSAFSSDANSHLKVLALLDPDLKPLWERIGNGVPVSQASA